MQLFKTLFIFLIGMISLTAMGSTPLLEKNKEATFCKSEMTNDVVNVQMNFEVTIFYFNSRNFNYILERQLQPPNIHVIKCTSITAKTKSNYSAKELTDFIYILERQPKLPDIHVIKCTSITAKNKSNYSSKKLTDSWCDSNVKLFQTKILIRNNC